MTSTVTSFIDKRWLQTIALLILVVAASCWERGLENGLRFSAVAYFVMSLMVIGSSSVLCLAWHQRFFTLTDVIACLYVVGYTSYALLQNQLSSLQLLALAGFGSGLVVGLGVAFGDRLRRRSDEA